MAVSAAKRLLAPVAALGAVVLSSGVAQGRVNVPQARARVLEASVIVVPKACAGALVQTTSHVLTAAHCIPTGDDRVLVKLKSGQQIDSRVEFLDQERDLALLHLDTPARARPLELSLGLPKPGEKLTFVGRFDRAARKAQSARVLKLGRCPSLPSIDDAVFTSLQAKPGDSGAPIVDSKLRVVAVVHGGSACHIAAPVQSLAQKLLTDPDGELDDAAPPPAPLDPGDDNRFGPFVFERTPGGFRFRFSFRFGSGD
jgi:S1-C subfamily serine protease